MVIDLRNYVVGIDVGTHSLGMSAIEVDDDDFPVQLLSCVVQIHDSGVDPAKAKAATTRLASSGLARRTRRLVQRRHKRLVELDGLLNRLGWMGEPDESDPYAPWRARASLAAARIADDSERDRLLGVAMRHIARHRGWRNPWTQIESLLSPSASSKEFIQFQEKVESLLQRRLGAGVTAGQLVAAHALTPAQKLRGNTGSLNVRLLQSDYANEILLIGQTQGIDDQTLREVLLSVFAAESPKNKQRERVGLDPLPGQRGLYRASKASDAFQRYRMVSVVANLCIKRDGTAHRLSPEELGRVVDYLVNVRVSAEPTWQDVADVLGVDLQAIEGIGRPTDDGERSAARPPVQATDRAIRACKVKALAQWWPTAEASARSAMIAQLSNGADTSEDSAGGVEAAELLGSFSDDEMVKLDTLHLPAGRAAYSENSLIRLTEYMLEHGVGVHEARVQVFEVADDWRPPAEPIEASVGNPAVDRVTKGLARWLRRVESEWGAPKRVTIEHVRSAFVSEDAARQIDRENNRRYAQRQERVAEIKKTLGITGELRRSEVVRYEAIVRQNCQCLYCGTAIDYTTAQMDHIVPRAGVGSTNQQSNLAAVCAQCNQSKGKQLFSVWAKEYGGVSLADAIERLNHWVMPPGQSVRDFAKFKREVKTRLERKNEDAPIDARSMESVAWMANEVAHRVRQHFVTGGASTTVMVYRGAITADARRASGIEGRIPFIGGGGKTRLDRRHHAVDASVVALMEPSVAQTLAQRISMRDAERFERRDETWKKFRGEPGAAERKFEIWTRRMHALADVLGEAMERDEIPVTENLRLRLGNGAAHDDTVRKLDRRRVGDELSAELIDRASTPALWTALTRLEDFDAEFGLPIDLNRRIRVHGLEYGPTSEIGFFGGAAASIAVRGGYAEIGSTIHHARIYRIEGKRTTYAMLRVFGVDLLPHRHSDLFSAPIPARSISMRTAEPKLRRALEAGTATYLGWLVTGDELELDMSSFTSGQIGEFLEVYPGTTRWKLDGFYTPSRLRLRPVMIAAEGLPDDAIDGVRKVLDRPGWCPALNLVLSKGEAKVIRRDSLGIPRWTSTAGLPTSWSVGD